MMKSIISLFVIAAIAAVSNASCPMTDVNVEDASQFQSALQTAKAGTRIVLTSIGSYSFKSNGFTINLLGQPDCPIVITSKIVFDLLANVEGPVNFTNSQYVQVEKIAFTPYYEDKDVVVSGQYITFDRTTFTKEALILQNANHITVKNSTFDSDDYGITMLETSDSSVDNCTFSNNFSDKAIRIMKSENIMVSSCSFWGREENHDGKTGILMTNSNGIKLSDNFFWLDSSSIEEFVYVRSCYDYYFMRNIGVLQHSSWFFTIADSKGTFCGSNRLFCTTKRCFTANRVPIDDSC